MKIDRLYAREGRDPFESMEFTISSSVIRNPDGPVVFEWKEVTVPKQLVSNRHRHHLTKVFIAKPGNPVI